MALFNLSNDWESNRTGDELCATFLKDGASRKKKRKNKHKCKQDDKSLIITNEIISSKSALQKYANKGNQNMLKSKRHMLKRIKKKMGDIHATFNGKANDKIPLDSSVFSVSEAAEKHESKKKSRRKRALFELDNGNDHKPPLKKMKIEKTGQNVNIINDGSNSSGAKIKKKKNLVNSGGFAEAAMDFKKYKNLLKNVQTDQMQHFPKGCKKSNKKIKDKKNRQLKRIPDDSTMKKPIEDNQIDPVELKKRKNQLEKLQNLLLQKQEKHQALATKKDEPVLTLRQKMMQKLKAARFRFLNEQIYTASSKETGKIFRRDPDAFKAYHEGYRQQVKRWPLNPLSRIIKSVNKMPNSHVIADFGCGEAKLADSVEQKVYSFDLVAANDRVTACDMAHVPLEDSSIDVAVFCLSLMGTNLKDYLIEANRLLKKGGLLKIAEVESRFEDINAFTKECQQFGFKKTWMDLSHNLFYFIDFKKEMSIKGKKKLPEITLQPCLYKKR